MRAFLVCRPFSINHSSLITLNILSYLHIQHHLKLLHIIHISIIFFIY
nr:MAG TPA: hypothetical protein [Caudoviricetes sp.]